jgi:hypothetical protein
MFDRNGLELSPVADTKNAYKLTSVNVKRGKFNAYARSAFRNKNEFTMCNFAKFDDPRDAAFVAQEFAKEYDKEAVRQMVVDGTFLEVANEFVAGLEIPEWKFPAEGLTIDDILCDYSYTKNHVPTARDALIEVFKVFGGKPPAVAEATKMIKKVDELYNSGMSYREAARQVAGVKTPA